MILLFPIGRAVGMPSYLLRACSINGLFYFFVAVISKMAVEMLSWYDTHFWKALCLRKVLDPILGGGGGGGGGRFTPECGAGAGGIQQFKTAQNQEVVGCGIITVSGSDNSACLSHERDQGWCPVDSSFSSPSSPSFPSFFFLTAPPPCTLWQLKKLISTFLLQDCLSLCVWCFRLQRPHRYYLCTALFFVLGDGKLPTVIIFAGRVSLDHYLTITNYISQLIAFSHSNLIFGWFPCQANLPELL